MARRDITIYSEAGFGWPGTKLVNVAAGATAILAGEPVARDPGAITGVQESTNAPVVATDFWEGIAATDSTQTASLAGTVEVLPILPGLTYLIAPKVAATWDFCLA